MKTFNSPLSTLHFQLLMMLLLVACASDEHSASRPILLSAGSAMDMELATRAPVIGTQLPVGDTIGVFGYTYTAGSDSWKVDPDVWHNAAGPVHPAMLGEGKLINLPTRHYDDYADGVYYSFTAYYPFVEGVTAAEPIIRGDLFAPDDASGNGQHDWMWSRTAGITAPVADVQHIALGFEHLTSMLWIRGGATGGVDIDIKLQHIVVQTARSQAFGFDISAGTFTPQTGGQADYSGEVDYLIPGLADGQTTPTETAGCILLLAGTRVTKLTFTLNGKDYTTPDSWKGFVIGKAGTYNPVDLVMDITTLRIEIGAAQWIAGESPTMGHQDAEVEMGEEQWADGEGTTTMNKQLTIEIDVGQDGWADKGSISTIGQPEMGMEMGEEQWTDETTPTTVGQPEMEVEIGSEKWTNKRIEL